jgi:hypothetical protein
MVEGPPASVGPPVSAGFFNAVGGVGCALMGLGALAVLILVIVVIVRALT